MAQIQFIIQGNIRAVWKVFSHVTFLVALTMAGFFSRYKGQTKGRETELSLGFKQSELARGSQSGELILETYPGDGWEHPTISSRMNREGIMGKGIA